MVFFSQTDPYFGIVKVSARGNLSIDEINELTTEVEKILTDNPGTKKCISSNWSDGWNWKQWW
jgi:multidrug efflux pump subunit AcrB